jgi:hypothetical protein
MKQTRFPAGWNEDRVRRVMRHYEGQSGDEAVAEDEAAFRSRSQTLLVVPKRLVPKITRLIAGERSTSKVTRSAARKTRRG